MIEPKKSKNALNKKQNKTQNCDNKTNKQKINYGHKTEHRI